MISLRDESGEREAQKTPISFSRFQKCFPIEGEALSFFLFPVFS